MNTFKTSDFFSKNENYQPKLFYSIFHDSSKEVKATLNIVHGMQEHSGRYDEVANYFVSQGFAVLTYDHLGHGKSVIEGNPHGFFQIDDPDERVISDSDAMADLLISKFPNVPHFVLGHSMGSFVTRCLLQRSSSKFTGGILLGTSGNKFGVGLLKGYFEIATQDDPKAITKFNDVFAHENNKRFVGEDNFSDLSWISVNIQNRENFKNDPLCGFPFTNNGFFTLSSLLKQATSKEWATDINKDFPMLFQSGADDPVGNFSKGIIQTVNDLKEEGYTNVSVNLYPGMRHEILNEDIKLEVMTNILNWLNAQMKK